MTASERKTINRDYRIRVYENGKTRLLGAGMLYTLLPEAILSKWIERLTTGTLRNQTYHNKTGLIIKFIVK